MADYRDRYAEIRSTGASVAAISVDGPDASEALRSHLSLPFPILCDTEHRLISDWGICDSRHRGGIAKPAVFVVDPGRAIRYAAVDGVVRRVPAAEMVSLLQDIKVQDSKLQDSELQKSGLPGGTEKQVIRRRVHVPKLSEWKTAIRNMKQP